MAKRTPHVPVDPHAADRFVSGAPPAESKAGLAPLPGRIIKRRITVYLDPAVADAAEALARETRRPVTGVIEIALRRLLGLDA